MNTLTPFIWSAGILHGMIALANIFLPRKIELKKNLRGVVLFIRQIYYVHTLYIILLLLFFGILCFFFSHELSNGSALGRFLSGFIAFFWLLRVLIQFIYYDPEIKRSHPFAHWFFSACFTYIGLVFLASAIGGGKW